MIVQKYQKSSTELIEGEVVTNNVPDTTARSLTQAIRNWYSSFTDTPKPTPQFEYQGITYRIAIEFGESDDILTLKIFIKDPTCGDGENDFNSVYQITVVDDYDIDFTEEVIDLISLKTRGAKESGVALETLSLIINNATENNKRES